MGSTSRYPYRSTVLGMLLTTASLTSTQSLVHSMGLALDANREHRTDGWLDVDKI